MLKKNKRPEGTVGAIMVTRLCTLRPDMDIYEAMERFVKQRISGAPVVNDNGELVGVLSEKDCLKVLLAGAFDQRPEPSVEHFMTTRVMTIDVDAPVVKAAELFIELPIRRLPVVEHGRLVGQISRRDVVQEILRQGPAARFRSPSNDVTQTGRLTTDTMPAFVGPENNRRF